jgi:hypothetical protein
VRFVIVPELDDLGVPFEGCLDDAALDAAAASVDDAHLMEAGGGCCIDVFVNDRGHVARRERVKIELVLDRNSQRLFGHGDGSAICDLRARLYALSPGLSALGPFEVYSALTIVLIPPRTEKSPTTVMRRGWSVATRSSRIWFVTCS